MPPLLLASCNDNLTAVATSLLQMTNEYQQRKLRQQQQHLSCYEMKQKLRPDMIHKISETPYEGDDRPKDDSVHSKEPILSPRGKASNSQDSDSSAYSPQHVLSIHSTRSSLHSGSSSHSFVDFAITSIHEDDFEFDDDNSSSSDCSSTNGSVLHLDQLEDGIDKLKLLLYVQNTTDDVETLIPYRASGGRSPSGCDDEVEYSKTNNDHDVNTIKQSKPDYIQDTINEINHCDALLGSVSVALGKVSWDKNQTSTRNTSNKMVPGNVWIKKNEDPTGKQENHKLNTSASLVLDKSNNPKGACDDASHQKDHMAKDFHRRLQNEIHIFKPECLEDRSKLSSSAHQFTSFSKNNDIHNQRLNKSLNEKGKGVNVGLDELTRSNLRDEIQSFMRQKNHQMIGTQYNVQNSCQLQSDRSFRTLSPAVEASTFANTSSYEGTSRNSLLSPQKDRRMPSFSINSSHKYFMSSKDDNFNKGEQYCEQTTLTRSVSDSVSYNRSTSERNFQSSSDGYRRNSYNDIGNNKDGPRASSNLTSNSEHRYTFKKTLKSALKSTSIDSHKSDHHCYRDTSISSSSTLSTMNKKIFSQQRPSQRHQTNDDFSNSILLDNSSGRSVCSISNTSRSNRSNCSFHDDSSNRLDGSSFHDDSVVNSSQRHMRLSSVSSERLSYNKRGHLVSPNKSQRMIHSYSETDITRRNRYTAAGIEQNERNHRHTLHTANMKYSRTASLSKKKQPPSRHHLSRSFSTNGLYSNGANNVAWLPPKDPSNGKSTHNHQLSSNCVTLGQTDVPPPIESFIRTTTYPMSRSDHNRTRNHFPFEENHASLSSRSNDGIIIKSIASRKYSHCPPHRQPPPSPEQQETIEISPGIFENLLGVQETLQAIEEGTIEFPTCPVCQASLVCSAFAEYVLCSTCKFVSPVSSEEAGSSGFTSRNRGGGVSLSVCSNQL